MREQDGGNGETRKPGPSFRDTCLSLVCFRRFLYTSRLGGICGQGEVAELFGVCLMSDISRKTTMQRHRMIYSALSEELKNGLHALSLNTKTQAETLKVDAHTPQGTR